MDPLSALAIAAAAFQFVDLGGKLLVNGWKKYKQMRQEMPDDQKLEEEKDELRRTFDDLSFQISGIRQVAADIGSSQEAATPAQVQLLRLLSNCTSLSSDFEKIKDQMKPPISRKMKSEIHLHGHTLGGSNRPVREEDCRECKRMKDEEDAELHSNAKDIERLESQLKPLRRNVYDSLLLYLWDDSKRTKQWELHFNNQLNKVIDLLESAQNLTTGTLLQSELSSQKASLQDRNRHAGNFENSIQEYAATIPTVIDEEVVKLGKALQPLIQPGKGPVSLKKLVMGINEYLKADAGETRSIIRRDLLQILWAKDWKLDISLVGDSSAKIDTTMAAHAIAKEIQFNTIQSREEAIAKSFETTFFWIFQNEPSLKDGKVLWDSFPKWLEEDYDKVYWITGKPGSGKSTIMKLILQRQSLWDAVSRSLGTLRLLLVKYYAWLPGDQLQKSINGLKKTVIFQALEQCPELAPEVAPRHWAFCQVLRSILDLPEWQEWEIEESFEALLSMCGKTIELVLFIDGLDEFGIPPLEVIQFIQHIKARCPSGLKLCVASRPWAEFQDEFSECPMLQMHLQSHNDMAIFVAGKFENSKAFIEQAKIHPEAASQLLTDIVQRANGVFIWVSIVVNHLLDFLSEGQSIYQARQVLEALPTDISSLYNAIWIRIRPEILPEASHMIQILRAIDGSLPWFKMWLIDELRFAQIDIKALPNDDSWKDAALGSLRRKLAARTKCILDISGDERNGLVDFTHRTARDWAVQPENWQLICSSSSEHFDAHWCILKAEALLFVDKPTETPLSTRNTNIWNALARILWHAGEVDNTKQNIRDLVDCLNSVKYSIEQMDTGITMDIFAGHREQYLVFAPSKRVQNDFLGLAAQFSVLSYIKAVTLSDLSHLSSTFSERSIGLLENAIFGYSYYDGSSQREFSRQVPHQRRLATVEYLLDQGIRQSKMHSKVGICNLRKELQTVSSDDPEYYSKVAMYLDKRDFTYSLKLRIKSFFYRPSA